MGRIPEETIQQILAATDIVELIGSYFPVKRAGANYRALCPFHQEKTPSFNINPARQTYHCFGCGEGGNAIGFVKNYENLDFPAAVRRLADRAGIPIEEEAFDPEAERASRLKGRLLTLHKEVAAWYHRLLFKDPIAAPARDYLKARGVDSETAREWQLGFAPESTDLISAWARQNEFPEDLLVQGGFLSPRDENNPGRGHYSRFRDRLMFPINNEFGETIAFSGRLLDPNAKAAKYLNSPETPIFNKSRTFFGFDKTKRDILRERAAIVCEGQLDLIACHTNGILNVVAPLGTAFTEQHARFLKRHADDVILCFDSDEAGYKAAERTFVELAKVDLVTRVAEMPPGEDPDSLIKARGVDDLRERLVNAKEFLDFQIEHKGRKLDLDSLRDRMQFSREIAESVALIDNKVLRESAVHKVATRLGIPAQEFRESVSEAKRLNRRTPFRGREEAARSEPVVSIPNERIRHLCHHLLTDTAARRWLLESQSLEFLQKLPGTALLEKVWRASVDPDNPASVSAFLSTLPPAEEACLSQVIHETIPRVDTGSLHEWIQNLRIQSIENQIEEKKSLMNRPNLSPPEKIRLLKEFLDLESRLNDISPFAPGRS